MLIIHKLCRNAPHSALSLIFGFLFIKEKICINFILLLLIINVIIVHKLKNMGYFVRDIIIFNENIYIIYFYININNLLIIQKNK